MVKCVVTGGAGFIGSNIVDKLLSLNFGVTVIDNFSSGKHENLKQHEKNSNLKIISKDICDKNLSEFFQESSVVFHLAAIPRVQYSINFPLETNKANIEGTLNVLEATKKSNIKRFIYSSSSSVYGNQDSLPLKESMIPNPLSPYALQKLAGEHYCKIYNILHGLETISLRYFNVYGPRQDPSGGYACLIPKSITNVLHNRSPEIYGDGNHTRDFTYVKDVVEANILAAKTLDKNVFGNIFNIGGGRNLSVNKVVNLVIGDKKINVLYKSSVIEPKNTLAGTSNSKNFLNWSPKYSFEEGLQETINWFKLNIK